MTTIKPATKGVITPCSDKYANIGIATILIEYSADLTFGGRFTNIRLASSLVLFDRLYSKELGLHHFLLH